MAELIDRQEFIRRWCKIFCGCEPEDCKLTLERDGTEECTAIRIARGIPTVEERIKDEWIIHGKAPAYILECSQCGQRHINYATCPLPNYCSHCGAYMRQRE